MAIDGQGLSQFNYRMSPNYRLRVQLPRFVRAEAGLVAAPRYLMRQIPIVLFRKQSSMEAVLFP